MTELTANEMMEIDGGILPVVTAAAGAFLVGYAIGTVLYEIW